MPPAPCPPPAELAGFVRRSLDDEAMRRVEAHVADCEKCRARLADLKLRADETRTADEDHEPAADEVPTAAARPANVGGAAARKTPDPEPAGLPHGAVIGRYVIVSELGKGGMGAVYLAYDPMLDRRVALKMLLGAQAVGGSSGAVARLEREARALARVAHPNAVAVYDAGRHGDQVVIAMERVEGETLRAWMQAKRDWRTVLGVLVQAARGLQAVHDAGLVHRDFKPSNVIVSADRKVKVLDFGLARAKDMKALVEAPSGEATPGDQHVSLDTPLTQEGSVSGTPGYIAPELFENEPSTAASDQFAFGVALFQALYGRKPFPGSKLKDYFKSLKTTPAPLPTDPKRPAWLWPVVMRMLAPLPEQRYPSMAAVIEALEHDPLRKWRIAGAAASVVLALSVAAYAGRSVDTVTCPSEAEAIERVWPRASEDAFRAKVLAQSPNAKSRLERAFATIDRRVQEWAQLTAKTCRVKKTEADALHARRQLCLVRQEQTLRTLVEALQQVDAAVVERADDLVEELLDNAHCDDRAHLERVRSDTVEGVSPEILRELRKTLLSARAFQLVEKGDQALELSRQAVAMSADAGLPGFEGEAWYWIAQVEAGRGDGEACTRDFQRAWELALQAGDDENAVYAGTRLATWLTDKPQTLGEARQVTRACQALWERLERDPYVEVSLLDAQAWLATADADMHLRLELRQRRADLMKRLYGERSREYAAALIRLAAAQWELGKVAESNALELSAVKMLREIKGEDDPSIIYRVVSLSGGLAEEGRRAEAIALIEPALARAQKELDPTDGTAADLKLELANALDRSDLPRSLALAQETVAFYETANDPQSLAGALRGRAQALTRLGRGKEALADCRRSATLNAGFTDPVKTNLRENLMCEAEALEGHDLRGALEAWKKAEALPLPVWPATRARLRFGLAKVLRALKQEPARAEQLGRQARDDYASLSGWSDRVAEIDAWLVKK